MFFFKAGGPSENCFLESLTFSPIGSRRWILAKGESFPWKKCLRNIQGC